MVAAEDPANGGGDTARMGMEHIEPCQAAIEEAAAVAPGKGWVEASGKGEVVAE